MDISNKPMNKVCDHKHAGVYTRYASGVLCIVCRNCGKVLVRNVK